MSYLLWYLLLTYSSSCQVAHKADTHFLHPIRSFAFISTFFHERPICFNSFSAVLRHVNFGLPLFRFPSAVQKIASLVISLWSFLSVWPTHLHFLLDISTIMSSCPDISLNSLFGTIFGHLILKMVRRQRFTKVQVPRKNSVSVKKYPKFSKPFRTLNIKKMNIFAHKAINYKNIFCVSLIIDKQFYCYLYVSPLFCQLQYFQKKTFVVFA